MYQVVFEGDIPQIEVGGLEVMRECAEIMRGGIHKTFWDGGYKDHWYPLRNGQRATLIRSGALLNSFNESNQFVTDESVEVYTPIRYAPYLHYGTKKMRKRPFVLWREDMKEDVMKIVGESVKFVDAGQKPQNNIIRGTE